MTLSRSEWCRNQVPVIALMTLLAGMIGLIGWLFDIRLLQQVFYNLPFITPLSIVCLISGGLSMWLLTRSSSVAQRMTAALFGLLVLAGGTIKFVILAAVLRNSNSDLLRIAIELHEGSSRSPNGGISFTLVGSALVVLALAPARRYIISQILALLALLVAFFTLIGYIYNFFPLSSAGPHYGMACHTVLGVVLMSFGILFLTSGNGFMPLVLSDTKQGLMVRNNSVVITCVIFLLASMAIINREPKFLGLPTTFSAFATFTILLLVVVSSLYAWFLHRSLSMYLKAESERRRSELEFSALFRLAAIGMTQLSARTGKFIRVNQRFCELTGYSEEELLRMGPADLMQSDDIERDNDKMNSYLAGEVDTYSEDKMYRRKDGTDVWVHITASSLRDNDGHVTSSIAMVEDITDRKYAEQALRTSEERERARAAELQVIMENVPAIVWIGSDPECKNITGSRSAYEFLRMDYGENSSKSSEGDGANTEHFTVYHDGRVLKPHEMPMQQAALTGTPMVGFEEEVRFQDGVVRNLIGNSVPLFDENGAVRGAVGAFLDITAIKETERRLQQSEYRLRVALEAGKMGNWEWTVADDRVVWSESLERLHGLEPGTFKGTFEAFQSGIHPEDRQRVLETIQRAFENAESFTIEYRAVRPDGSIIWVEGRGTAQLGPDGTVIGMTGICMDVTQRRQTQERIRRNEEWLKLITDSVPVLVSYLDREQRFVLVNSAYTNWFELSEEEIVGRHIEQVIGPVAYAAERGSIERVLLGQEFVHERWMDYESAGRRFVRTYYRPHRNEQDGAILGFFSLVVDMTARKNAEDSLWRSEQQLRAVLQNLPVAVWLLDAQGDLILGNPAAREIFGEHNSALLGDQNTIRASWHDTGRAVQPDEWAPARCLREKQPILNNILDVETPDGARTIQASCIPISDDAGTMTGVIVVSHDITHRILAESALKESELRFRHLANSAPVLIWMSGPQKQGTWFNKQWLAFTGRSMEQELGGGWMENVHPNDYAELQRCEHAFQQRTPFTALFRMKRYDGEYRWMHDSGVPHFDPQGNFTGFIGSCIDVTELEEVQQRLRAEVRTNEALYRVTRALTQDLGIEGVIQHVTIEATEITGAELGAFFQSSPDNGKPHSLHVLSGDESHRFDYFPFQIKGPLIARTFSGEGVTRLHDVTTDPRYFDSLPINETTEDHLPVRSYLAVPVVSRTGKVHGGMFFLHSRAGVFGERAEQIAVSIAHHAAVAIDTALLFEEKSRLAAIVANSDDAIYARDPEDRIISWNAGAERIFGYSADEVIGKPASILVPHYLKDEYKSLMRRIFEGERIQQLEAERLRRDGRVICVSLTISPISERNGELVGISTIARDVTDIKRAEQDLRESEERFRSMADAAPVLIWVSDEQNRFEYVNRQLLEFTGQSAAQAAGRGWLKCVHPSDCDYVERIRQSAYELRLPFHIEYRLRHQEMGYRWILDQGIPRFAPDGAFLGYIGSCIDITERKKSEEESARLAAIVESSYDAIIGKTLDGTITSWNKGAERVYGYTAEQVIGRSIEVLIPEYQHAEFIEFMKRLREGRRVEQIETKRRRRDGSIIDVSLTISPLIDSDGNAVAASAIARDITQLKQAMSSLRESELRFRVMADATPVLIWMADTTKARTYFNRQWLEFTGRALDQEVGDGWTECVHPDDVEYFLSVYHASFELRQPFSVEYRLRHHSGEYRWLLDNGTPLFAPDGAFQGFIGGCIDIDQRINAEQALKQSEEEYRATFEVAGVGKMQIDAETLSFVRVNQKLCEMLRYTSDELLKLTLPDVAHPEGDDAENFRKLLNGEISTYSAETRYLRSDGSEMWGDVTATVIRDTEGRPLRAIAVVQDITDRRAAEEERRKFETQFQQVQKLESLGILAGGIAHDFNNLLVGILGNVGLAAEEISPNSKAQESLQDIEVAARRAADLCRQMLAYSGKGRFIIEAINLNDLVREMNHLLSVSVSKNAIFKLHLTEGIPLVQADATQLRQVVMNLIINASEALGEKPGVISVTTGAMDCDEEYLRHTVLREELTPGLYVYFEVADTGAGMPPDVQQRIFDPFYTTKFTGRGLGLAAVLGIARGHKGAIRLFSEPGKGTTFRVLLPAAALPQRTLQLPESTPTPRLGSTILLVDDSETVRAVGRRILERSGFRVLLADDGIAGVELFKEKAHEIDCVILDLTMPRMNGDEALRLIRNIRKDIPVVLSSGYNEQEVITQFEGQEVSGFVQKPYQAADLIAKLSAALAKSEVEDTLGSTN